MAKVSLLIPTYNRPLFLRRALESALNQTRLPDEILIFDDNPDSDENYRAVKDLVEAHKDRVFYRKNPENLGVVGNYRALLESASGELVKFLSDDDFLHPEAIERMVEPFEKDDSVGLVACGRAAVDLEGEVVNGLPAYLPLVDREGSVDVEWAVKLTLKELSNRVGEFSAYMFRKELLDFNPFNVAGVPFHANADWVLWMGLLLRSGSKLHYIPDRLVAYTVHPQQDQSSLKTVVEGVFELANLLLNREVWSFLGYSLSREEVARGFEKLLQREIRLVPVEEVIYPLYRLYRRYIEGFSKPKPSASSNGLSVVIVTYNNEETLRPLFETLLPSLSPSDEVIVVDNASTDSTPYLLKELASEDSRVKVVLNKENRGYAPAANQGADLASKPLLLFLNPDTALPPGWRSRLERAFKDRSVGALSVLGVGVYFTQHVGKFSAVDLFTGLKEVKEAELIETLDFHVSSLFGSGLEERKFLSGFFLATPKELFEELGGFDEELILGMDDLDYCLRVRERGFKPVLLKGLAVSHNWHHSFKKSPSESNRLNELSVNRFADKLVEKYGYGRVPPPEELWSSHLDRHLFYPFVPTKEKFRFMFRYGREPVDFPSAARTLFRGPKVAVVTVCYYSSGVIGKLAESLSRQSYGNFTWILIDHSESEEELEKLKNTVSRYLPPDKFCVIPRENRGFAAGVNSGASVSLSLGAEFAWFLNPDVELPSRETLFEMLKNFLYTGADLLTCEIRDSRNPELLQYDGLKCSFIPFKDPFRRLKRVAFLTGSAFFCRPELLKRVPMAEHYFLYFEDNRFKLDLEAAGYSLIYTPFVSIVHRGREVFPENPVQYYYFVRNEILFRFHETEEFIKNGEKGARFFLEVLGYYLSNVRDRKVLRALTLAVHDGVGRVSGRRRNLDELLRFKGRGSRRELKERFMSLRRFSKRLALKAGLEYLLTFPKDKEAFTLYLKDAHTLLREGSCGVE